MRHLRAAFLALALSLTLTASFGAPALALTPAQQEAAPLPIHTEIPIPTSPVEQGVTTYSNGVVRDVADYIQVVYNFLISIVGMVAAVMMIIGGFEYLTSAGDAGKIGAARKRITDAVIGLVLALGSYALLNTINPALLQFKPLSEGVTAVATHLSFLPWCDELPPGTSVEQVNGQECGDVGLYKLGKDSQYCAYRGSCVIKNYHYGGSAPADGVATCLQQSGLTTTDVEAALKKNLATRFALCLPCANLSPNVASSLHMGIDSACQAWQDAVSEIRAKTPNQSLWTYCQPASGYPGCVAAEIDCHAENGNEPDAVVEGGCSDNYTCGCGGYDDQPSPIYLSKNLTLDEEKDIEGKDDAWTRPTSHIAPDHQMDLLTDHLAALCAWNPCKDFVDPSSNKKSFANGCKGIGISKLVPGVRAFTSDCRNN